MQGFVLLSPIFEPITLTVGKFYDFLAAMLDFNISEHFKVWYYIENKYTHHFGLILKIVCFYPQNARFCVVWQLSKWTNSTKLHFDT